MKPRQLIFHDAPRKKIRLGGAPREGDLTGEAGKGHGRTGHAGTQFEPDTEAHAKERASIYPGPELEKRVPDALRLPD